MDENTEKLLEDSSARSQNAGTPGTDVRESLVKVVRNIEVNPIQGRRVDGNTVAFKYFNCFNYSLLPRRDDGVQLTLGITSANQGEGKSLAAANLAVSLGMGYQKKTVLVDLNLQHPSVHETFDVPARPGLVDALNGGPISVSRTKVPQLFVLSAGNGHSSAPGHNGRRHRHRSHLRIDQLAAFGEVIFSLEQEYEFVILDMPAINGGQFPILFANRLSGLLVVVDTTRTKKADLEKMFRQVNERQVLGFIYNRTQDDAE